MSNPGQDRTQATAILRLKQARLMLSSGKSQLTAAQEQIDEAQKLIDESEEVLRGLAGPEVSTERNGEGR